MTKKRALMIGLDPAVVEYSRWPGLTAEKLLAVCEADRRRLAEDGIEATTCFVQPGSAEETVRSTLKASHYDCILIGAGVRTDPAHFRMFERLINVAHEHAPQARLCFNTGPTDSAEAIRRWLETA